MPALSFSFSKKAEPKRVVEALVKTKEQGEKREAICGLEAGAVTVDGPQEAKTALTIACKNPLEKREQQRPQAVSKPKAAAGGFGEPELDAGLITRKATEKLSAEDAEAMRELLKDAAAAGEGGAAEAAVAVAAPILMREGSKKARDGSSAPEASKDMYETVPVEAFGEAMLRGMGYDPAKHNTKPVFHDKLRDNLLGLGAKALLPSEKAQMGKKRAAAATAITPAEPQAKSSSAASASAPAEKRPEKRSKTEAEEAAFWPSRGLIVRLIGRGAKVKDYFGTEAVVLEADNALRSCKVKFRFDGKSVVIEGVGADDLETRVRRDCQSVRVVSGQRRGEVAKLVRRDAERGVAVVKLDGEETELPLDKVCQFTA